MALPLGAALLSSPVAAVEALPGPPLPDEASAWGAACPAPRSAEGPWNAAGFGVAVVAVGWIARRQGSRD